MTDHKFDVVEVEVTAQIELSVKARIEQLQFERSQRFRFVKDKDKHAVASDSGEEPLPTCEHF